MACTYLFLCLPCTKVTNLWHGHTCLHASCVPAQPLVKGMIDHMPAISHYHHLAVWASLFAYTLCPSPMMYVHTPAMTQCQKIGKLSTPVHPPDTSRFCRMAERSCLFAYLQCFRAAPLAICASHVPMTIIGGLDMFSTHVHMFQQYTLWCRHALS